MTIITTNAESFQVINGEKTYEIAYNGVWISSEGNAVTLVFQTRKYTSLINDRFDRYNVDGTTYGTPEELIDALSKKLFKNPEGGGEGKGAAVLKYEDGQITYDGTPLTKAEIEELMAEQGLVVLSADAYGLQGVVCLPYLSEDGKLTFVGTVQSGGVDATIMYAMDDEDAVEGPTIVANETLSNKADSIIETYAEDQIRMYPTIYAVLNFVYGQQYASVKVVSELPTDEETKGYFTDIYIKYEDGYYKAYKMVNGEWVVLNPKSTKKVVYNSESGTVSDTYANIKADLESGVHVYVDDNRGQFTYSQYLGESITFTRTSEDKVETVTVNSDGTAAYSSVEFSDFRGMTDDEARTVSEALNDLNNRIGEVEEKGMTQSILTYDGNSNTIKDEQGNVMTMAEIITLIEDKSKFVYLKDDFVLCLPAVNFYKDAVEFTGTYVMNGYTTTARVIINFEDQVSEYHLTSEKSENKATTLEGANDETYPTTKAVKDYVDSHGSNGPTRLQTDWYGLADIKDADGNRKTYDQVKGMLQSGQTVTIKFHPEYRIYNRDLWYEGELAINPQDNTTIEAYASNVVDGHVITYRYALTKDNSGNNAAKAQNAMFDEVWTLVYADDYNYNIYNEDGTYYGGYSSIEYAIEDGYVIRMYSRQRKAYSSAAYIDKNDSDRIKFRFDVDGVDYVVWIGKDGRSSSGLHRATVRTVSLIQSPYSYIFYTDYIGNGTRLTFDKAKTLLQNGDAAISVMSFRQGGSEDTPHNIPLFYNEAGDCIVGYGHVIRLNGDEVTYRLKWTGEDQGSWEIMTSQPKVWNGTQEQYDALTTKENGTLYLIEEEE